MKTKKKMTLARATEIGLSAKFEGLPHELDSISVSEALTELQKAVNAYPASQTLREALEVVRTAHIKEWERENANARPIREPDIPPPAADPRVTSSWRERREWR
jgi:hypothetical protein